MTRLEQLTAIRDAVRDGRENDAYDICKLLPIPAIDLFQAAFRKDMNAALALFAALLPGWDYHIAGDKTGTRASVRDLETYAVWIVGFTPTPDPARALLLAVLEALIAKEEG
jgi:hypothetical protein